jgi:polygalacturonase
VNSNNAHCSTNTKRERQVRELRPAKISRRTFLVATAGTAVGCAVLDQQPAPQATGDAEHHQAWEMAARIRQQTIVPTFPDRQFDVRTYGAVNDGITDNSEAFAKAIAACHEAGGGRVIVPAGFSSAPTPKIIFPLCSPAGKVWNLWVTHR